MASAVIAVAILAVAYMARRSMFPNPKDYGDFRESTVGLTLVVAVLMIAARWGWAESIVTSLIGAVGFAYYFQPPFDRPSLTVDGALGVIEVLATAVIGSRLSVKVKRKAEEAIERRRETERLYELGRALLLSDRSETMAWTVINQMIPIFGVKAAAFCFHASGEIHRAGDEACVIPEDKLKECARSQSRYTDERTAVSVAPVRMGDEPFGSVGVCGAVLSDTVLASVTQLLTVMVERMQAAERLAKSNEDLARQNQEVLQQRQISESLLLNILPREVADELRIKGIVAPKYFEDVTIMFTDFVGFTLSTEKLAAEDLVQLLHDYFTVFDQICARYGLEKMKTIGDSYMCLSGLPKRNPSHPVDTILAAFEMVHEVMRRGQMDSLVRWKVRVGVHTGPVIAGVVGINKFAFDIWGDTVNYSSRMESSGVPNRINISERTYSRIKDFFDCEYRGKVLTKDKREVDMFFVKGLLPRLLDDSGKTPPPAFLRRYNTYFQKDPPAFPGFLLDPGALALLNGQQQEEAAPAAG